MSDSTPTEFENHCLRPFHRDEAIEVCWVAHEVGKTERTVRNWCIKHSIGRRPMSGGAWIISKVALRMLQNGDSVALKAYLAGQRQGTPVASYYERAGLADLLELPEFKGQ